MRLGAPPQLGHVSRGLRLFDLAPPRSHDLVQRHSHGESISIVESRELTGSRSLSENGKVISCLPGLNISRSGGIGKRAWFRSMYPQGCRGSSPFFGTSSDAFARFS